jgi:hypothetical protein
MASQDIPITSSDFWQSEDECTLDVLKNIFRSCTDEEMPMLEERLECLREAGKVLYEVCPFVSAPIPLSCRVIQSEATCLTDSCRNTNAALRMW